jgi:hypothetical protein
MTQYEKTIESLGLSDSAKRNATIVTYKKIKIATYVDGGGLDQIVFPGQGTIADEISHELFCKMVDNYNSIGLIKSAIAAGATIMPMKAKAGYYVYNVQGYKELWRGKIEKEATEYSYRAGYIANLDNLDYAIEEAAAEMRALMAEAN